MPKTRFNRLDPEARRRILDAAQAEFVAHGYDGASINGIIQAAGIHKGSLYYYFEDKADLFLAVLEDMQAEMIRRVADLDIARVAEHPPADFWGYLESASLQKSAFAVHHPELTRLAGDFLRQASKPGAPPRFAATMDQLHEQMRTLLRMGQAQGAVRTDLPLAMLVDLTMAVTEIMNAALIEDPASIEGFGPDDIRRYAAPQHDMLRRMLSAPEGGTPR